FVLQDFYAQADREMKERILEGIGRIGSSASIPFLVECLKEPFQSLRVIAASSLLQVLYH
ncbi:MAG TPA: HEAT repeat domain-containing protein, partial [Parachlamydiaceae bacterium]|nr:HEAT repeat domain-containing protein [Parachlamydiaceae bacterium]